MSRKSRSAVAEATLPPVAQHAPTSEQLLNGHAQQPAPTPVAPAKGKKTRCPINKAQFLAAAKPLMISIDGTPVVATVKEFSTGSFGWYLNGKTVIKVGDTPVEVQLGFNLTLIGSKEAD